MSRSAQVHSLESIEAVRVALLNFSHDIEKAVAGLDIEIRRMLEWLEHDRPAYWKRKLHQAHDAEVQAKAELNRCLMFPIVDERPSCHDERKALQRAQQYRVYCEEKADSVRAWIREVRHEQYEYQGRISSLSRTADIDLALAVARLSKLIERLEEYQAIGTNSPAAQYDSLKLVRDLFEESVVEDLPSTEAVENGSDVNSSQDATGFNDNKNPGIDSPIVGD